MRKTTFFKSLLLLCALIVGSSAWAEVKTDTYIFTAKNWTATFNGSSANWTSGKDGGGYSNEGIQVTTSYTGANGTSPVSFSKISKIVVTYNTNKSGGEGTIGIKIGDNDEISKAAVYGGSGDGRTAKYELKYDYTTAQSGNVTITVNTTTNSIYLCSIAITYDDGNSATQTTTTVTINGEPSTSLYMGEDVTSPTSATVKAGETIIEGAAITWSSTNETVATINPSTGAIAIVGPGETTIKASYDGDEIYKKSEASYTLTVYGVYTSLEALQAAATTNETNIKITFNNVLVTAINGKNAYIIEGQKGAQIVTDGHGLEAGNLINGTLSCKLKKNGGNAQITNFNKEGLTITNGTLTPAVKTIDQLSAANHGMLVTLKGVNYLSSTTSFTDGTNSIKYYDTFKPSGDDALAPEDGKAYDVTGIFINYNGTLEISPRTKSDLVEVVSEKDTPISAWKQGEEEIKSICVAPGSTIIATFETNSTGEKSFESSDENVATVTSAGVITLKNVEKGMAIITAKTAGNDDYISSVTTLTILVGEAVEDAVFNFANFQDYGSGIIPGDAYYEDEATWTAGNATLKTTGKYRWYIANSGTPDLRLYGKNEPYSSLTVSVPDGYVITSIKGVGSLKSDVGTVNSGTWTGLSQSVNFSYESTSSSITIKSLTITYTEPTIDVTIGSDYTTFCNASPVSFAGKGVTVYTAKQNNGYVTLTEVEDGIVPAGKGVILKGTAGNVTIPVVETSNKLSNNEMVGVTEDTEVPYSADSKFNYILQSGKFYKATGAKLKAGKAYLKTAYDVTAATGGARLQIVIDGETNAIANVRGQMEDVKGIFNLQGQRVEKAQKGLYIMNGKKVLVK